MSSALLLLLSAVLVCVVSSGSADAFDAYADIENYYPYIDSQDEQYYELPEGFLVGSGNAAYQTEGAWNEDGKGENIWDHFFHYQHPELANGDVACDTYHKYKDDVQLSKNTKLNFNRISLSWARILPNGTTDNVNQKGVDFYNNFINEMIANGITPVITLYHWDLPQEMQINNASLTDSSFQDYFLNYARFAFETFGDRVQWWTTFNEPHMFCTQGFETGSWAPGIVDPGVSLYQCAHNVLIAHAKAYQAYYEDFSQQGGQVGFTMDITYAIPLDVNSTADQEAAQRAMEFEFAWFADPIMFGDYPDSMRTTIDANSKSEGRNVSRLPEFTDDEKKMLRASADFLGVNHYTTVTATPSSTACSTETSNANDRAVTTGSKSSWSLGPGWSQRTPWGMRGILNWIKNRYNNYPMFITENGYLGSDEEALNDFNRVSFISGYMRATLRAVNENSCNVLGYSIWCLMDNLQWINGYSQRFGVGFTHFDDPDLKRVPKKSANFMRNIMAKKRVTYYAFMDN